MVMAGEVFPPDNRISEILVTFPETDEKTGEDTAPEASAIRVPTLTRSPALTIGFAGTPICMDVGMVTDVGGAMRTADIF
jgi:hypothetical protein